MPIRLSTKNTVAVYLIGDEAREFPFVCHYPSANERIAVIEKFREFDAEEDPRKRNAILIESARMVVNQLPECVAWETLADTLTFEELNDLTTKMLTETSLKADDKGKSAPGQQSDTAGSAPAAPVIAQ